MNLHHHVHLLALPVVREVSESQALTQYGIKVAK
jgi:hypothetical protein